MPFARALSLVFLVLTLVSGTASMATARHMARGLSQIVICTGFGVTAITLDADGNPVPGKPVLCPDCLPAMVALTETTAAAPEAPGELSPVRFASREIPAPVPPAPAHALSTGPPVLA